jgi:hypothetical protein
MELSALCISRKRQMNISVLGEYSARHKFTSISANIRPKPKKIRDPKSTY